MALQLVLYSFSKHNKPLREALVSLFMQVWGPETLLLSLVATLFFEGRLGLDASGGICHHLQ